MNVSETIRLLMSSLPPNQPSRDDLNEVNEQNYAYKYRIQKTSLTEIYIRVQRYSKMNGKCPKNRKIIRKNTVRTDNLKLTTRRRVPAKKIVTGFTLLIENDFYTFRCGRLKPNRNEVIRVEKGCYFTAKNVVYLFALPSTVSQYIRILHRLAFEKKKTYERYLLYKI